MVGQHTGVCPRTDVKAPPFSVKLLHYFMLGRLPTNHLQTNVLFADVLALSTVLIAL